MKSLIVLSLLLFSFSSQASRLLEIEDYYSKKASDFLKMRYPRKAFTVYVKVDAEDSPQLRNPSSLREPSSLNLPYLNPVNKSEVNFWDRKDLSLGTLISYLKSIYVRVEIDGSFSSQEVDQLKMEIFQYLKLSELYDRIEINQKAWTEGSSWKENWVPLSAGGLVLLLMAFLFMGISQLGVSRLVKGLSQPLSEIGRSAENVANAGGLMGGLESSFQMANKAWDEGSLDAENIKRAEVQISNLSAFLADPSAELIQKIESIGEKNPFAMGAIFSHMPVQDLKSLVRWARGEWWRVAVTQVTPLNHKSLEILEQISHLRTRETLIGESGSNQETAELKKLLARLSSKQLGQLMQGYSFDQAKPILWLLPHERSIEVGKYLYPGEWAELLTMDSVPLSSDLENKIKNKINEISPLKSESEIQQYFKDADLISLLDQSSTKDERDIYKVLPEDSWIKMSRQPFYGVFQDNDESLEKLTSNLPLEVWAQAMRACDRAECEKIYQFFTARQKFLLRDYKKKFEGSETQWEAVEVAKKKILSSLSHIQAVTQKAKERENEVSA